MSEEDGTQSEEFDAVAFREHEDHENKMTFLVKIPIGVVILLALAALINHWLVSELGQADGDLASMIIIPFAFTGFGMLWMGITGQV